MKTLTRIELLCSFVSLCAGLLVLTVFHVNAQGQSSAVDPSFAPTAAKIPFIKYDSPGSPFGGSTWWLRNEGQLIQPDDKLVIWGRAYVVDDRAKGTIARLNPDGTVDNTFNYCACLLRTVVNVALQPDGKFLVAGEDKALQASVVRMNADGSPDSSSTWRVSVVENANTFARVREILPDGKALIEVVLFESAVSRRSFRIYRVNQDGSRDALFNTVIVAEANRDTWLTAFVSNGQIYLGIWDGFLSSGEMNPVRLRRFNPDGTEDLSWTQPSFTGAYFDGIHGIAVQPDGALIIAGDFDTVNGVDKKSLARLLPSGAVDSSFTPPAFAEAKSVIILSNGKLVVAARLLSSAGPGIYRLNSNGSIDTVLLTETGQPFFGVQVAPVIDSTGAILSIGRELSGNYQDRYFRLFPDGTIDRSYNRNLGEAAKVESVARQTDGKIVVAGNFSRVNGAVRNTAVRLYADGGVDPAFDAGAGFFPGPPTQIISQPNGKVVAIGSFTKMDGEFQPGLARLNADGKLDLTFRPSIFALFGYVLYALAGQPDGRFLIGGEFESVNGVRLNGLARFNADGSLDTSFMPLTAGGGSIRSIATAAGGKVVIGGRFNPNSGINRVNIARLNSDGTLDHTFDAGTIEPVAVVFVQPDGKLLVVTGTNGPVPMRLKRLNTDGSVDTEFNPVVFAPARPSVAETFNAGQSVDSIVSLSDGSIIVGGVFHTVNGVIRENLVRLRPNGTLDTGFLPQGTDGRVRSIAAQPDGKVVIGGYFSRVEYSIRPGIARLSIAAATFDFDGDGRSDVSVFRPSNNNWYSILSGPRLYDVKHMGASGDVLAPADFDGDGRTDLAVFRPSTGTWLYRSSLSGTVFSRQWGQAGDVPRPSDFDGDGRADFVLFRPSNSTWYRLSATNAINVQQFGEAGDNPLVGDFDGDGESDLAVFRPSTGQWFYLASSIGHFRVTGWGANGDIPAPADFDGDGRSDIAVFRPSNGNWYIRNEANGSIIVTAFGVSGDKPIPADYDGDGKADIVVFRPSNMTWYLKQTTAGFTAFQFGVGTDIPIPGAFIP